MFSYNELNATTGLYRAAIMESGSALNPFGYQRKAKQYAYKIASYVNSNITEENTSQDVLTAMVQASAKDIDVASKTIDSEQNYTNIQIFQGYFFAPVLESESEEAFLTEKMFEVIERGDAFKVPIIIGINSEESLSAGTNLNFVSRLMSAYGKDLKALVPFDMNIESDSKRSEAGERIRKLYSGEDSLQNDPAAGLKYMSDTMITRAVIQHALLQSVHSDVYFYQFSYDGKIGNVSVVVEGTERVGHNEEIPYLWRVRNAMFDNYDLNIYPDEDITTQNRLLKLWTNFAKTLNPTPEKSDFLQNVTWPTVSVENEFSYLDIGKNLEIRRRPKETSFKGWSAIYNEFGVPPYDTY